MDIHVLVYIIENRVRHVARDIQTEDFSQVASVAGGRKGVTKWCVTNMVNPSRAAILSHVPGLIICAQELFRCVFEVRTDVVEVITIQLSKPSTIQE